MLHRLANRIRNACPRTRRCALAGLTCLVAIASVYYAVERPHIGWGPAIEFNEVRAPESGSLADTTAWLGGVADALIAEGYEHTVLQVFATGQVFGLVKPINDMWEYHVHGYVDGRLKCEVELSRRYIQHVSNDYRADASGHLVELLEAAGIGCVPDNPVGEPAVLTSPRTPVSWTGLVFLSPVFQALVSLDDALKPA